MFILFSTQYTSQYSEKEQYLSKKTLNMLYCLLVKESDEKINSVLIYIFVMYVASVVRQLC